MQEIKITQYPVIAHKLQEAGKSVTERIKALELDKQVATVDTVKSLKDLRAELNKELSDLESQRKAVKEGVNKPYLEFEDIYKTEISDKYKSAIDQLKDLIGTVEDKVKSEKRDNLISYFSEFCVSMQIDFIKFEQIGIEVNLSTTEKKYKEQINEFITKVTDDLALIKSTDFEAEILTEYKQTLNASKAITTVKERKEREFAEAERLKAETVQNRKNYLQKIGMNYVEITNCFEYNADIYISIADIYDLSKEEFTVKYVEVETRIKDLKTKEVKANQQSDRNFSWDEQNKFAAENTVKETSAPLSAPTIEQPKEEIKIAQFEVKATMSKLRALGEFMKANQITYKNI